MSRDVLAIADAGPAVGLGHLSRSSAVITALRSRSIAVEAHALGAHAPVQHDGVHWLPATRLDQLAGSPHGATLLDSYRLSPHDVRAAFPGARLVCFHDEGDLPEADLVVSWVAVGAGVVREAALRPALWDPPVRRVAPAVGRVLVTTGAGDPGGHAAGMAAAARRALPAATVVLVVGPQADVTPPAGVEVLRGAPSLADELARADVVVTTGGQTLLEAAATGAACVAVVAAPNQAAQVARLVERGAAVATTPDGVELSLRELAPVAPRAALAGAAQAAIDGRGALRIADRIVELTS